MGKRTNKLKKAAAPLLPATMSPPTDDDNDLMDTLLAQLDSRDETVQQESANVLNDMQLNQQADQIGAASKQDPKSRFRARQVTHRLPSRKVASAHSCRPGKPCLWHNPTVPTILRQKPGFRKKQKTKNEI